MKSWRHLAVVVTVLAILVAACGGGSGDDESTTTEGNTPTTEPDDSGGTTSAPDDSGSDAELTHDEIVALAEEEPPGLIALTISGDIIGEALAESFNEKYPFAEAQIFDSGSSDAQTVQLELAAGRHESDVVRLFEPQWKEYIPYLADFNLYELAEAGSLTMPLSAIEPEEGKAAYTAVFLGATAFNPDRVAEYGVDMSTVTTFDELLALCPDQIPPGQMTEDLGPDMFASLGVAMGLDGLEEYARALNEQCDLTLIDGNTGRARDVGAGEYTLSVTGNHHAAREIQGEGGNLEITFLEPVPGLAAGMVGINATSERPYMSLLYIEHLLSPEGQAILDEMLPCGSLIIEENAGHCNYEVVQDKETSIDSWATLDSTPERNEILFEAWDLPSS